jgi:RNA polymerase sigma factor (sigma-70 family)
MTTAEFNKCVDLYADGMYRFVLKNIRDEDEAHDLVQDSFEKIWQKHAEVSFEKAKSYFFSTAYHAMIDRIRKKKRQADFEEVKPSDYSYSQPNFDVKKIVNEAVNQLPDIQKAVLLMRDYEGYSYEEIGEMTGLNESQVKVYIYRARVFLKEYIVSLENVV